MATRLNFTNWRLVDLDNYMGGNPPFTQQGFEDPWERLTDFQHMDNVADKDALREPMPKETKERLLD